jgi:hypothetical protein
MGKLFRGRDFGAEISLQTPDEASGLSSIQIFEITMKGFLDSFQEHSGVYDQGWAINIQQVRELQRELSESPDPPFVDQSVSKAFPEPVGELFVTAKLANVLA